MTLTPRAIATRRPDESAKKPTVEINMSEIEKSSGNVYADIDRTDAYEMRIKVQLAMQITAAIKERKLTQDQAAELVGMTQPKMSNLIRGKFSGISQAKMIECLNRLGNDVEIVIRPTTHTCGITNVVFS